GWGGEIGSYCLFFFQAEDGIRDWSVTGVQTCALPIFNNRLPASGAISVKPPSDASTIRRKRLLRRTGERSDGALPTTGRPVAARSEERRVGKEGRWGGWAER